jgi:DNA-binding NarL/FixJ family response regulator
MVWISVAAEALHFTDGRLSLAGALALMGVVAGLAVWCVLDRTAPGFCDRVCRRVPLSSGMCCVLVLLPATGLLYDFFAALYGASCGLFLASALTCYIRSGDSARGLFKIGLSAGIYTTAVYPVGLLYGLIAPRVPREATKIALFLALCCLSVAIAYLRPPVPPREKTREQRRLAGRGRVSVAMIVSVVVFAALNHLLNSGILEQNGGTTEAPYIFFANVLLRLPMGMLIGWLAERGKWYYAVGFPLALMAAGCAVALLAGGGIVSDHAMLGVFNCGGAGIVIFIHALGMQASLWRGGDALAASFGSLVHFTLVAFFNVNALGVTPPFFAEVMRFPLTFLVIVTSIPTFLLIMAFLVDQRLMLALNGFFTSRAAELPAREPDTAQQTLTSGFSQFESEIAVLLIDGLSRREIYRKLHRPAAEVDACLTAIRGKMRPEAGDPVSSAAQAYGLTRRESDVLRELRQARTNAEIAAELFISEETVRSHTRKLIKKLPVSSRREIPAWLAAYEPEQSSR